MGSRLFNKKISLTIGVPAHNEEGNIRFLLQSILNQKAHSYSLEKIIVVCDGCTDGTARKVREIKNIYPLITLINSKEQMGKKARLLQLYKLNRSDILVTCDGDIVLNEPYVLEKLIKYFKEKGVVAVSGNNQPIPAENFVGKLVNQWAQVWYTARSIFKNGHNIHNARGTMMALRDSFAKTLSFDKNITSDAQFIYFTLIDRGLKFRFAKESIVIFRKPDNLNDYLLQSKRDSPGRKKIAQFFGQWIYKEYQIPLKIKLAALTKMFILSPFWTTAALIFNIISMALPAKKNTLNRQGMWKTVKSTKKGINLNNFNANL